MKRRFRISRKYGTWYYEQITDSYNSFIYYINGKDEKGNLWKWKTPFYNEIRDFIKASPEYKKMMVERW